MIIGSQIFQRKVKAFWTEHKTEILLTGAGIGSAVLGVVWFKNLTNHLDPEKNTALKDEYKPFLMTGQNGDQHRLFKWNGSKDTNPDFDMFFFRIPKSVGLIKSIGITCKAKGPWQKCQGLYFFETLFNYISLEATSNVYCSIPASDECDKQT